MIPRRLRRVRPRRGRRGRPGLAGSGDPSAGGEGAGAPGVPGAEERPGCGVAVRALLGAGPAAAPSPETARGGARTPGHSGCNSSDLVRGENLSAGEKRVGALCVPGAEEGGEGHPGGGAAV